MLIGWPKGQKQFLMERGLWVPGLKLQSGATAKNHTGSCCSKRIMYQQLDFQQSVSQLEELIRASGHVCLFLPQYHCELVPIEHGHLSNGIVAGIVSILWRPCVLWFHSHLLWLFLKK